MPGEILKNPDNQFLLPREVPEKHAVVGTIDCPQYISWADSQKDASAWLGNTMQNDAARAMYQLLKEVRHSHNKHLLDDWRKLSAADHLYYISTKGFSDGDVHKYFSPYKTPYDAFINMMNVLENMRKRLSSLLKAKPVKKNPLKKTVTKAKPVPSKKVRKSLPKKAIKKPVKKVAGKKRKK
jgi:alpha-amylase